MRAFLKYLLAALLVLVLGPLILAFMFFMPIEFCVASWQLAHLDGQTVGEVLESGISYNSSTSTSTSRSDIHYRYFIGEQEYFFSQVRAGWFSNKSWESGGGDLASTLKPGMKTTVYYSKTDPSRSVLEYGWPKWSIGFSLGI